MRILWIGTKSPFPPVDGGRLVVLDTLRALATLGAQVTLVAPAAGRIPSPAVLKRLSQVCRPVLVPARPRPRLSSLVRSAVGGKPYSIVRHRLPAVASQVAALLASEPFDVVHVEQLQALSQVPTSGKVPAAVVFRAQNVESDLWAASAQHAGLSKGWLQKQSQKLARWEGKALRQVTSAAALTRRDALRLQHLAGAPTVEIQTVPAPFASKLPLAAEELAGDPPVVLLGSRGWPPNQQAARWFVGEVWPEVRPRLPRAQLHLFGEAAEGPTRDGVVHHLAPVDSREAFAEGAIQVVPLKVASGVRMKILESWARGVPVVATPQAAAGLDATSGSELLLAEKPREFAEALGRLVEDATLNREVREAGRVLLAKRHDPQRVGQQLMEIYRRAANANAE